MTLTANRSPFYRGLCLAVVTIAVLAYGLVPAGAAQRPVMGADGGFAGFLNEVTCVSAADCWAFGQNDGQHAVAEHWNGTAWSMVKITGPAGAVSTYLPSVSCPSAAYCWAVGQYQQSGGLQVAYAEHWNGRAWSPVAVPVAAGSTLSLLLSVSCASAASCWAVGFGFPGPFLEHWNGRTWSETPDRGFGSNPNPERVSCSSAKDCWLAGSHGNGAGGGTFTGHWTGGSWRAVTTPTSDKPADGLNGISCLATACMAVGQHDTSPLAQRWNGTTWTVTPAGTTRAVLNAVSCPQPSTCMAVGGSNDDNGRVFTERWTGSQWHVVPAPSPTGAPASLVSVNCISISDCWGAGSYTPGGTGHSLLEHWNGHVWTISPAAG